MDGPDHTQHSIRIVRQFVNSVNDRSSSKRMTRRVNLLRKSPCANFALSESPP